MTKKKMFLLGVLLGQLSLLPYIHYLIKTPSIQAEIIPDCYEYMHSSFDRTIKNYPHKYFGTATLHIHLAPNEIVQKEFEREYHDTTPVMGFYDLKTNTIWCVYDALVLIHELRHVTEGAYHR